MSFDEEQRIAIFEMVKDGSMTIEEAHAEVGAGAYRVHSGCFLDESRSYARLHQTC